MWRPKFKWERTDFIIPGLNKKLDREAAKKSKVGQGKLRELRRKQFFNFLADFFDKLDAGNMDGKVSKAFKFDPEEREKWLKRYFMKYFMEVDGRNPEMVSVKVDQSVAHEKRHCSCSKGSYDNKGEFIPPCSIHKNKPDKFIKVPMVPEIATREMIDAQLGMSMGIKTKMDPESANIDLDEVLNKKLTKIEKRSSVSPVKIKEDIDD